MTADSAPQPLLPPGAMAQPPFAAPVGRWSIVLGAVLMIAMIVGLGRQLADSGLAGLRLALPGDPLFYLASVLVYLCLPVADYIIFRRLWGLPLSGLAALLKKRIANEVVLGYSGEAYFYAWVRQKMPQIAAPLGAVKDVSILSAIAGNVVTLAMVAVALPFAQGMLKPADFRALAISSAIVVAISLPFLVFSRRVFSLPVPQLRWIFMVHCARLLAGSALIALAWHFAMPQIALGLWLLLAAARLLVSRLPLVPNKDLLFANFAILFIGQGQALSTMVALSSALALLFHVMLIGAFSLFSLLRIKS